MPKLNINAVSLETLREYARVSLDEFVSRTSREYVEATKAIRAEATPVTRAAAAAALVDFLRFDFPWECTHELFDRDERHPISLEHRNQLEALIDAYVDVDAEE